MHTHNTPLNHPVFRLSQHLELHVLSAKLLANCQATQAKILQASEIHMTEPFFDSIKKLYKIFFLNVEYVINKFNSFNT